MSLVNTVEIKTDKVPLMVEMEIDPSIAPYLISTTKSFLWLDQPLRNNLVRVAIRKENLEQLFGEIVQNIYEMGVERKWENTYALTKQGLRKAIEYLHYYGIEKVEILSSESNPLNLGKSFDKAKVSTVSWLSDCYAVVPKDRFYFGSVSDFGDQRYAVLIHNPSRGIAFSS